MQWEKLLSQKRLNVSGDDAKPDPNRSPWLVDLDRITFSLPFRHLQGKTQVHPLDQTAQVRTRLTHSFEVASVGRSLGYRIGLTIVPRYGLDKRGISAHDFADIVQVACLAHDIGNPPFGHAGEDAMGYYFRQNKDWLFDKSTPWEVIDNLQNFEGNAQGFRILNKLTSWREQGGLRLTFSTLATFCKYPRMAINNKSYKKGSWIGDGKCGIYHSEKDIWQAVSNETGLLKRYDDIDLWARHPFAFLVEAADDICYTVADLEDAVNVGIISFKEAEKQLLPFLKSADEHSFKGKKYPQKESWYKNMNTLEKLDFLRGKAIGNLIDGAAEVFIKYEADILSGQFNHELLGETVFGKYVKSAKNYAQKYVFSSQGKLEVEVAAHDILNGLLNNFCSAYMDVLNNKSKASPKSLHLLKILNLQPAMHRERHQAFLHICDFVSAMTDHHAINLYRKINGISM